MSGQLVRTVDKTYYGMHRYREPGHTVVRCLCLLALRQKRPERLDDGKPCCYGSSSINAGYTSHGNVSFEAYRTRYISGKHDV